MKILLIYPPHKTGIDTPWDLPQQSVVPPLGSAQLTALLQMHGTDTKQEDLWIKTHYDNRFGVSRKRVDFSALYDPNRINEYLKGHEDEELSRIGEVLLDKIKWRGFDVYGFSVVDNELDYSVAGATLILSKILKERTDACIIAGGPAFVLHGMKSYPIDQLFSGGNSHIPRLLDYLRMEFPGEVDLSPAAPQPVSKKGSFRITEEEYIRPDFTGLPLELYGKPYFDNGLPQKLVLPYKFVAGCLSNCIFCCDSLDPNCFAVPPDIVAEDLEWLSKKYKARYFMFLNSNFNPTYEYAEEVSRAILERDLNILFSDCANLRSTNPRLLKLMRVAGATRLIFGLETGSPRMLQYIRKGIIVDDAKRRLKQIHQLGLWAELELIAGLPTEREEDVQFTLDFMQETKQHVRHYYLSRFKLFESQLKAFPEKYGLTDIAINDDPRTGALYHLRYAESGGLSWNEKMRQIENSYLKIHASRVDHNLKYNINLNMLLPLYDLCGTPKEVVARVRAVNRCAETPNPLTSLNL